MGMELGGRGTPSEQARPGEGFCGLQNRAKHLCGLEPSRVHLRPGRPGSDGEQEMVVEITAWLSSARPALALAAHNSVELVCDGDSKATVPWLLFPGYHNPHPPLASTRNLPGACLGTHCPSPSREGGGGEKTQCLHSTGHPPVTMATQQLAVEPAHQSCIILQHKGPRGPALRLNLRLSEMGMRSLWSLPPRCWPLSGPLCSTGLSWPSSP